MELFIFSFLTFTVVSVIRYVGTGMGKEHIFRAHEALHDLICNPDSSSSSSIIITSGSGSRRKDRSGSGSSGGGEGSNVTVYDLLVQSPHKAFVETQLGLLHSSKLTSRLLLAAENGEVSGSSSYK